MPFTPPPPGNQGSPGPPRPGKQPDKQGSDKQDYGNVPVIISGVLAAVAGLSVALFSTGGTEREFRWELGIAAACVTFIVTLLILLVLIVTSQPNPEHLGKGTGIRRSFGALPNQRDDDDGPGAG